MKSLVAMRVSSRLDLVKLISVSMNKYKYIKSMSKRVYYAYEYIKSKYEHIKSKHE